MDLARDQCLWHHKPLAHPSLHITLPNTVPRLTLLLYSALPSGRPYQQAAFTLSGQQRVEDRKGLAGIKEQGHQCSSQLPITSCNVLVLEMPGQLLIPYVITKEKRPSFPSLWWGPLLHAQFGLSVRSVSIEVKDV